jgi:hypothetical protein
MKRSSTGVLAYLLGLTLSVGLAVLANLLLPGSLSTLGVTFAVLVPMSTLLAVDRLTTQRELSELRRDVLEGLLRTSVQGRQIIRLDPGDAWVRYFEQMAPLARAVYNTRLTLLPGVYDTATPRVDRAALEAIRRGAEYHLVCATEHDRSVRDFRRQLPRQARGKVEIWMMETAKNQPLMQMKILDYGPPLNSSEAMIGFVLLTQAGREQPTFLVRDPELVEYFRYVFRAYTDVSRPLTGQPPDGRTGGPSAQPG